MTVWILNRGHADVDDVRVVLRSNSVYRRASVYRLTGTGADDPDPHWGPAGTLPLTKNTVRDLACPALSVTVLTLTSSSH